MDIIQQINLLLTADKVTGVTVETNIREKKKTVVIHAEKDGEPMHIKLAELDLRTEKNGQI